jgi:ParB-like chromosome segregation protein Spo0J
MKKDLKVEHKDISSLKPYTNNAKLHPEEQIAKIARCIKELGFLDPVAVDENNEILEGHGRLLAAKLLGLKTIPTITIPDLSKDEKIAYRIAHNKLTMDTGWDFELLQFELKQIEDLDISLSGFDKIEFSSFYNDEEDKNEDQDEDEDLPSPKEILDDDLKKYKHTCPECGFKW